MALILDAGALLALDRREPRIGAVLRVAQQHRINVRTSAAVVAQVWRDGARQANLARVLAGVDVVPIDNTTGRRIGTLLARSGTADVVDGHIGLLADPGDVIVTSDIGDITKLIETRRVDASVERA